MSSNSLIFKGLLALIGCVLGAYVGQGLLGGGAIGWTVTGAIVGGCVAPLFKTLFAWREERDRIRRERKG